MSDDEITCPKCGGTIAGVQIQGAYDGALFWRCMACGHPFHRFPPGSALRAKAQSFITAIREAQQ